MFNTRPEKNDKPLEHELYIVHDKDTKRLAVSLCTRLTSVCRCVHWDEKHYHDNEYRATNKNRFLFLSDKLITENLLPGLSTEEKILDNVMLIYSGNMYGLKADVDSASPVSLKDWRTIIGLLPSFVGAPVGASVGASAGAAFVAPVGAAFGAAFGAPILWGYFMLDEKKRTRIKLLFDGVKYLTEDDHYKLIIRD